ncbi:MAG: helix-turn-helix transcriptional regulator [Clostridiales bacterium]|nr:helix-turn-helix transcriptional regulator [Clostridiales bacterium]
MNNIKKIRRSTTDFSQQELADLVNCTRQTIVALENQKYNPSLVLAIKISEILKVKIDDLFELSKII